MLGTRLSHGQPTVVTAFLCASCLGQVERGRADTYTVSIGQRLQRVVSTDMGHNRSNSHGGYGEPWDFLGSKGSPFTNGRLWSLYGHRVTAHADCLHEFDEAFEIIAAMREDDLLMIG